MLVRVGVVFLVAVTAVAVLLRYVDVLRGFQADASTNASLSFSDREVAGGNELVADQTAAYAARAIIPEHDSYHVAVDPGYAGGGALTVDHVAAFYRYFLLPRRPAESAPWVICYGCDLEPYGPNATVVWQSPENICIVRLLE